MVTVTDMGGWEKCLLPSQPSPVFRNLSCSPSLLLWHPTRQALRERVNSFAMCHKAEANKWALMYLHCEQAGEREFEEGFKRQDVINWAELAKHFLLERWHRKKRREHQSGWGWKEHQGCVCISEMVLESDEARAGFSKEKQEVDLKMVKAFILRSQGPGAAPTDLRLTLRSQPEGWMNHEELWLWGIPELGSLKRNVTSQWGGPEQGWQKGFHAAVTQPGQLRFLCWVVGKHWSLDTFWEDKKGKKKWKLPESHSLNGREVVRLLTEKEEKA